MKHEPFDKKKLLREQNHLTRPPRLEGKVKNARMNPIKKRKKIHRDLSWEDMDEEAFEAMDRDITA